MRTNSRFCFPSLLCAKPLIPIHECTGYASVLELTGQVLNQGTIPYQLGNLTKVQPPENCNLKSHTRESITRRVVAAAMVVIEAAIAVVVGLTWVWPLCVSDRS